MKIINIDAPKEFVEKIWNVRIPLPNSIKILLEEFEGDYYDNFEVLQNIIKPHTSHSSVWKFECGMYENIAVLRHTIPIHLRDKALEIDRFNNNCKCIVDPLGAYISYWGRYTPHIELYLPKIYREAEKFHKLCKEQKLLPTNPSVLEGFKFLSTIVLLHELAHAALDIFNLIVDDPLSEKVTYDADFGKWREESMANAVALKIINRYGRDKFKNYAKKFMELQSAEYALGVKMVEDFDSSDFDSVFNAKIHGVDDELQQKWLDYAQGKTGTPPDSAGLKAWNAKINSTFLS
jgi:hypothetical protein